MKQVSQIDVCPSEKFRYDTNDNDTTNLEKIPEGATHFKIEIDYRGVYYEGDSPSYKIYFYKEDEI